jgi:hypothetical protein
LFKTEFTMIALCSKIYFCFGTEDKLSCKGVNRKTNHLFRLVIPCLFLLCRNMTSFLDLKRKKNVFHKAQRLKYKLVVFLVHDVIKHFIFPYFKKNKLSLFINDIIFVFGDLVGFPIDSFAA